MSLKVPQQALRRSGVHVGEPTQTCTAGSPVPALRAVAAPGSAPSPLPPLTPQRRRQRHHVLSPQNCRRRGSRTGAALTGAGREYFYCPSTNLGFFGVPPSASFPAGDTSLRSSERRKQEISRQRGAVIYASDAPLLLNDFITRH